MAPPDSREVWRNKGTAVAGRVLPSQASICKNPKVFIVNKMNLEDMNWLKMEDNRVQAVATKFKPWLQRWHCIATTASMEAICERLA